MASGKAATPRLAFKPVTSEQWPDLERLFGSRGACGGCWCMYWRLSAPDFETHKGASNKRTLKRIIAEGEVPGVLGYHKGEPVGWCAIAPRPAYIRLARSRVLKPVDDELVWSVTCFFIAKPYRGRGVSVAMLKAAVQFAKKKGARTIEGYPVDPAGRYVDTFAYTGLASAFLWAGFKEVARRSPTRPIMRLVVRK